MAKPGGHEVDRHSETILATLRQIIRAIDLHSKDLAKRYGLTGPQLLVLKELDRNADLAIGQVAQNVSLSQATVTTIIDRLEKWGFVQRVRNTSDKRKVNVSVSEKALAVLRSDPELLQVDFIDRFEKLEEWEKNLLISSLQRIATMMKAGDLKSPPVLVSGPLAASASDVGDFLDG